MSRIIPNKLLKKYLEKSIKHRGNLQNDHRKNYRWNNRMFTYEFLKKNLKKSQQSLWRNCRNNFWKLSIWKLSEKKSRGCLATLPKLRQWCEDKYLNNQCLLFIQIYGINIIFQTTINTFKRINSAWSYRAKVYGIVKKLRIHPDAYLKTGCDIFKTFSWDFFTLFWDFYKKCFPEYFPKFSRSTS